MLICPLCSAALGEVDNGVACPAGHRFDRARQGYLNLLPVQHKKSLDPGDNAAMVEARRQFLGAGHYAPLARRLAELAAERAPRRWLDIGCGEGYYSARLGEALAGAEGYALDISREAVKRACRRAPQLSWLVASMARLPLADASCELIASVFSPIDWNEAVRVLAPPAAAYCAWARPARTCWNCASGSMTTCATTPTTSTSPACPRNCACATPRPSSSAWRWTATTRGKTSWP